MIVNGFVNRRTDWPCGIRILFVRESNNNIVSLSASALIILVMVKREIMNARRGQHYP